MSQGTIKKLVSDKGFGFIEGERGELFFRNTDLFEHTKCLDSVENQIVTDFSIQLLDGVEQPWYALGVAQFSGIGRHLHADTRLDIRQRYRHAQHI